MLNKKVVNQSLSIIKSMKNLWKKLLSSWVLSMSIIMSTTVSLITSYLNHIYLINLAKRSKPKVEWIIFWNYFENCTECTARKIVFDF